MTIVPHPIHTLLMLLQFLTKNTTNAQTLNITNIPIDGEVPDATETTKYSQSTSESSDNLQNEDPFMLYFIVGAGTLLCLICIIGIITYKKYTKSRNNIKTATNNVIRTDTEKSDANSSTSYNSSPNTDFVHKAKSMSPRKDPDKMKYRSIEMTQRAQTEPMKMNSKPPLPLAHTISNDDLYETYGKNKIRGSGSNMVTPGGPGGDEQQHIINKIANFGAENVKRNNIKTSVDQNVNGLNLSGKHRAPRPVPKRVNVAPAHMDHMQDNDKANTSIRDMLKDKKEKNEIEFVGSYDDDEDPDDKIGALILDVDGHDDEKLDVIQDGLVSPQRVQGMKLRGYDENSNTRDKQYNRQNSKADVILAPSSMFGRQLSADDAAPNLKLTADDSCASNMGQAIKMSDIVGSYI